MKEAKRVAKNTGFLYARMIITVFISLYSTRLILGALGASDFGIFSVVAGVITMLTFLNNAMAGASQRFMSYAQGEGSFEKQKQIFNVSIILHFVVAIVIVLILEIAGFFLFNGILVIPEDRIEEAKLIYQFMLVSTFFTIVSVPYNAVINAHENMFLVAVLGILEAVLKLAIAVYIVYTAYDKLIVYGLLIAVLAIVLLIIRRIYCNRNYDEVTLKPIAYFDKRTFKEMSNFAGWSLMGTTSSMLGSYGQGIVLNMFFGTAVNAAQGVASQVSGQLSAFATTMMKALNPLLGKSEGAKNRSTTLRASMVGSKTSFFLLMLTFIPVLVEMPYIFRLWLKDVPEFTIIFCKLLLFRNLVEQMYATLTAAIAAVGKIKKFQMVVSFFYFSPLVVSFFLFKFDFPAYWLYLVFLIFSVLTAIVVIYFAKTLCSLSVSEYFKDVVARCFGAFAIVFFAAVLPTFFLSPGLVRLLLVMLLSFVFFLITVWIIGYNQKEQDAVKLMYSELKTKRFFRRK